MNTKKTLILALVLGVSVLYLTKVLLPGRARQEDAGRALSGVQESEITRIDVSRRSLGGQIDQFTISRTGSGQGNAQGTSEPQSQTSAMWVMPAIRGAVLDTNVLGEFLKSIRDLPVEDSLAEREVQADLSVYGLDKPVLTLVVHTTEDTSIEVAFGKKNEYLSQRYVKVSGRSGVFLVPDALFSAVNKQRSDIRSKNPIQFKVTDVRKAIIASPAGRIVVSQPAVGEWKIIEPRELAASKDAVDAMLNSIRTVTVTDFIDTALIDTTKKSPAVPSFENPKVSVQLEMREGADPSGLLVKLSGGANDADTGPEYVQVAGVESIYRLSGDLSSSLTKGVNDLRERAIVALGRSSFDTVVSGGGKIIPTTIAADGLVWTVNGKDGDPVFIEQYLQDLSDLQADDFPDTVPVDAFESPYLTLTITSKEPEKQTIVVTIGKEFQRSASDLLRYVKTSRSETVYAIRDVEAKRLVPHEEALAKQATPAPEPTERPAEKNRDTDSLVVR